MSGQRALVVVDVQRGFDDPALGPRDNPQAEENVAKLIDAWRRRGDPIVIVQHDWPGGPLERGTPGFELKEAVAGEPDLRIVKTVHSSFHGDVDLDAWLRERGIEAIAVCGIQTNFCCETTARIGSDLGYDVWFVLDATHTFDDAAPDGEVVPAAEIARMTGINLQDEFAEVVTTEAACTQLGLNPTDGGAKG
jgi:nicotinamidase-related amidase